MYNWITLFYSRNYHNTVNYLYFNKMLKNGEKKKTNLSNLSTYYNFTDLMIGRYLHSLALPALNLLSPKWRPHTSIFGARSYKM